MVFTWDATNLCVVFRSWRVTGAGSLVLTLVAVVLLGAGYEAVREAACRYDAWVAAAAPPRPRALRAADDLRELAAIRPASLSLRPLR